MKYAGEGLFLFLRMRNLFRQVNDLALINIGRKCSLVLGILFLCLLGRTSLISLDHLHTLYSTGESVRWNML